MQAAAASSDAGLPLLADGGACASRGAPELPANRRGRHLKAGGYGHTHLTPASGVRRIQVYRDGMGVTLEMCRPPKGVLTMLDEPAELVGGRHPTEPEMNAAAPAVVGGDARPNGGRWMTEGVLRPIVSVAPRQVEAATLIHDHHMPGWAGTDRALTLLAQSVPGLDPDEVTLKAAVVDRLYYTRHYRLGDALERIVEVLGPKPARPATVEAAIALVEAMAPIEVGGKTRWHWSFASKFAHWFLHDSLPIYDTWAIRAITHHFGRIRWQTTAYRDFAEHVHALREASGLDCTIREMDRLLWLSGMYRAWLAAADRVKLGLSGEVVGLFVSEEPDVLRPLGALLGEDECP